MVRVPIVGIVLTVVAEVIGRILSTRHTRT